MTMGGWMPKAPGSRSVAGRWRRRVVGRAGAGHGYVNDRDLIERCRAGEREAQRELFEQTSVRIYRLLLRMTGNPDDPGIRHR